MKRRGRGGGALRRRGDPVLPLAGPQHGHQRPADEPEALGQGTLPACAALDRRAREQEDRNADRAPASRTRGGADGPRGRPPPAPRPPSRATGGWLPLARSPSPDATRSGWSARAGRRRWPTPTGGQLHDVPVGVAQVHRLGEAPLEHLGAGHALADEVVAPGPQLLLGARPPARSGGSSPRPPSPARAPGTRGR